MLKSIAIKRCACILLTLLLLFDCTYTKKQEADAFAFVLTPVISKILLTCVVACGVGVATNEDAQKLVSSMWNGMSVRLKEVITLYSELQEFAGVNLAVFGSGAWEDFKSFVSGFFSISGGTITSVGGEGLDFTFPTTPKTMSMYFDSKLLPYKGYVNDTDYKNIYYEVGSREVTYYLEPLPGLSKDKRRLGSVWSHPDSLTSYSLPYVWGAGYLGNPGSFAGDITEFYRLELKGDTFNLNYISSDPAQEFVVKTGIPTNLNLREALQEYFTGGTVSKTIEYTVDTPYFPTAEGSICPSVPKDKVMTLPFVNPDTYVPSDTLVSDLLGNVGYQDIPADFPLAPPISPPADGILGFLENIWSSIKAIPQSISTSLSTSFERFFDVSEFKLDFSSLKNAGIQNKFPFCIPFDLYNVLKTVLKPGEVDFHVKLDTIYFSIDYMLPIHLPIFQLIRNFFRWSCLFGFIISLISGTRNLIKW